MITLKGIYEWKLINAISGKIENQGSQPNVVSDEFIKYLFVGTVSRAYYGYAGYMGIQLSDSTPDPLVDYRYSGNSNYFNILDAGSLQYGTDYMNWDQKSKYCDHNFAPPGSPRTINVIGVRIDSDFYYYNFVSFIELSTPITQNTDQYLYVKYTIYATYTSGYGNNSPSSAYHNFVGNMLLFTRYAARLGSVLDNDATYNYRPYVTPFLPPVTLNNLQRPVAYLTYKVFNDFQTNLGCELACTSYKNYGVSDIVGPIGSSIFQTIASDYISGTPNYYTYAWFAYGYSPSSLTAPSISRVFSHQNGREAYPFSDPSYPASSQGTVIITGTPDNRYPVKARIRITKTGDASDITDETINYTAVDTSLDTFTVAQDIATGDILKVTTTDTLPSPLLVDTNYYCININATTIKLATTYANAIAGTAIDITTQGAGDHTFIRQNTGQYKLELEPWGLSDYIWDNLSMAIDYDGYVMPAELDATTNTPNNYAEGDYIATSSGERTFNYGSTMLRGTVKNGDYLYSIQQSRKGLINNVCRQLFYTVETSQPLCKFGTGSTLVNTIFEDGTYLYIATNEGVYRYTFSTPTTAPSLLSITGLIDSNIRDACLDPITGYMWTGHTTGLCKVDLSGLTATQYLNTSGQPLEGLSTNEINVYPGTLDVYNGRVIKGGNMNESGSNSCSAAWVMDDGVGYYRVNGTTTSVFSATLRKGTNQVVYRLNNSLRLYTVTVTGLNIGTSNLEESWTPNTTSYCGAFYGQITDDTFIGIFNYTSYYQIWLEYYKIGEGISNRTIVSTTQAIPYYFGVYDGCAFGWAIACIKRNLIDVTGYNTYILFWHRYLIYIPEGKSFVYGWTGSDWELDNPDSRNIPSSSTHSLVNGLSIDFNNATGVAWDQQFINTEFFSFAFGPTIIKDNLQTISIQERSYCCQAVVVETYSTSVPASAPYEVIIPEISDPNYRELDSSAEITEVFEGATEYTYYDTTAVNFTATDSTDILYVGTNITTGTPVIVYSSNNNPTYICRPLQRDTIYYAINVTSTTIRVATSYANALSNTYIDILNTGGGSSYQRLKEISPTTETYRHGRNGTFVFSSADAGNSLTLTYTYTKFTS